MEDFTVFGNIRRQQCLHDIELQGQHVYIKLKSANPPNSKPPTSLSDVFANHSGLTFAYIILGCLTINAK